MKRALEVMLVIVLNKWFLKFLYAFKNYAFNLTEAYF